MLTSRNGIAKETASINRSRRTLKGAAGILAAAVMSAALFVEPAFASTTAVKNVVSVDQAARTIQDKVVDVDTSFSVNVKAADSSVARDLHMDKMIEDDGKSTNNMGDYIYLEWMQYYTSFSVKETSVDNVYTVSVKSSSKCSSSYLKNEKKLNNSIDSIISSLKLNGKSTYKKIKAIYNYVTSHVKYDKSHTYYFANEALAKKKATCQGYALLFYRLCRESGVPCRIATGTANGTKHAWNIVKLNGKWYQCDSCWDAGKSSDHWSYFLKGRSFQKDHSTPMNATATKKLSCSSSSYGGNTIKVGKLSLSAKSTSKHKLTIKANAAHANYYQLKVKQGRTTYRIHITDDSVNYTLKGLKSGQKCRVIAQAAYKSGNKSIHSKQSKRTARIK